MEDSMKEEFVVCWGLGEAKPRTPSGATSATFPCTTASYK